MSTPETEPVDACEVALFVLDYWLKPGRLFLIGALLWGIGFLPGGFLVLAVMVYWLYRAATLVGHAGARILQRTVAAITR